MNSISMTMTNVLAALECGLDTVQNPGWYIGGEPNSVDKSATLSEVNARILLAFPDTYPMGMSHNGTRVLYHILNQEKDVWAERAFAPLPDMAEWLRTRHLALYSLESKTPANMFDIVGISLQSELNFTAVPYILELAQIPVWTKDRKDSHPFIVGGGPCMANPEPVADFYDFFVIGDGEEIVVKLTHYVGRSRREGKSRASILAELHTWKGIYVPSLWPMTTNSFNELVPEREYSQGAYEKSGGVKRVWIEKLDPKYYPTANPIANGTPVHDRYSVEVMRGCTQGCRFCQAGYWYRPNRELNPADVIELTKKGRALSGDREIGLLSLSTADYSRVHEVTDYFTESPEFAHIKLSLPSMRANQFGQRIAMKAARLGGGQSTTFAPETGSERLRKIINKTISDRDMVEAAEGVFSAGVHTIKLYTMVGLPTENEEDMEAFCGLIDKLVKVARRFGSRNSITVSMGIFIPKTVTPFQWAPFMDKEKVIKHLQIVRNAFRGNRSVKLNWAEWDTAFLEAYYSRGDRNLSQSIYAAYQNGSIIESHTEYLNLEHWKQFFAENSAIVAHTLAERELTEVFPWDIIHAGVSKSYLKVEYKKAFNTDVAPLPDCKWGDCHHCGIPGNYADIQIAPSLNPNVGDVVALRKKDANEFGWSDSPKIENGDQGLIATINPTNTSTQSFGTKLTQPSVDTSSVYRNPLSGVMKTHTWRIWFKKLGLARYLAHQVCFSHFEKALRRLDVPLRYSEGWNPRPQLRMAGALPLGMESHAEMMLVDVEGPVVYTSNELQTKLAPLLPVGFELCSLEVQHNDKFPEIEAISYLWLPNQNRVEWETGAKLASESTATVYTDKKGIEKPLDGLVLQKELGAEQFAFVLKADASGNTPNPYLILSALSGIKIDEIRTHKVTKFKVHLKTQV